MDRHARWLQRHLVARVARRLVVEAGVTASLVVAILIVAGMSPAIAGPWAIVVTQLWLAARLGIALRTNPLSHAYLQHYLGQRIILRPEPLDADSETGTVLASRDLFGVVTLRSTSQDGEPSVDVYQTVNRVVTAVVSRNPAGKNVVFASRLVDGRLFVTTGLVIPPTEGLFVNLVPGGSVTRLLDSHTKVLHTLARRGLRPVTTGPELAVDLLETEQRAYELLGPALGAFLALESSPRPSRLQVTVEPADLRHLALTAPISNARDVAHSPSDASGLVPRAASPDLAAASR
jgi:hypothetical protein